MIIANLYIEKSGTGKPRTIVIWRVYARTDFEVARLLANYFKSETIIQGIIRRVHLEGKISIKYKKVIKDLTEYESWMVFTNNLAEVSKIYMELDGIHDFKPSYGLEDAIDVSQF